MTHIAHRTLVILKAFWSEVYRRDKQTFRRTDKTPYTKIN